MSRRILVIYYLLLLFIIFLFPWHPLLFISSQQSRMTDSKYFSTTRKGKPKFWLYVQFATSDRTNKREKKATQVTYTRIYKWPVYLRSVSLSFVFFFLHRSLSYIGQRNNEISIVTYFFFFLFGIKSSRTGVLRQYFFSLSLSFYNMRVRWRRRRRRRQAIFFSYILIIVFLRCPFFLTDTYFTCSLLHECIAFLLSLSYHSLERKLRPYWISDLLIER